MNLFRNVHESWIPLLHSLAYKEPLMSFLDTLGDIAFQPDINQIFKVFEMPVQKIKVVLLGQEPYPVPKLSNGLAYGVRETGFTPNTLRSIEREVYSTKGIRVKNDNNDIVDQSWKTLEHWRDQGVFLLNISLTVETGGGSHSVYWREFTEAVIAFISAENPCIWMLWGGNAMKHTKRIQNILSVEGYDKELIEEIPIDSKINYIVPGKHPMETNFLNEEDTFSYNGFYNTNVILKKKNLTEIIW